MGEDGPGFAFGRHVFGAGIVAMGMLGLAWGAFDQGQPVPQNLPGRLPLAYAAAGFMLIAGLALQWRKTAAPAAAGLAVYYLVIVVGVMNGATFPRHWAQYGFYSGSAEQLAIAAGAAAACAANARIDAAQASRLTSAARIALGLCAILFGGAHFVYMNLTAPLVPRWLPPSQVFWGAATGLAQIAAGLALVSGAAARLAAILLTLMYAAFTILVHAPMLPAAPADRFRWSENALNLALIGVAWATADALADPTSRRAVRGVASAPSTDRAGAPPGHRPRSP